MVNTGALIGGALGAGGVSIVINGVDNFSNTFKKANVGLAALAAGAAVAATAFTALTVVSLKAIKTAASFETAFTGVRKTVDLSEEGFSDLEERFKEITRTTPVAFEELSRIGELAGQLGVSGVNNLEKFTKTIADISVTTNLSAEQAATDFARISNIMQEPLENVDKLGAAIVDLGNNFATTEAEISEFAQRIAGGAKIAGLTTSDILAMGAAFSSVGVQAEAGGTAVQKVLTQMTKSVAQGDEKLQVFAETAGMTAAEFATLFEEDGSKAFEKFVLGLGEQGDKAFKTLEDLSLQDQRLIRSFLSLANAGDLVARTFEIADKSFEENIALTTEAEKRYATFDSQMKVLNNDFRLLFADIGDNFLPLITEMASMFLDEVMPSIRLAADAFGTFIGQISESGVMEGFIDFMKELGVIFVENVLPALGELGDATIELFKTLGDTGTLKEYAEFLGVIAVAATKVLTVVIKLIDKFIELQAAFKKTAVGGVVSKALGGAGLVTGIGKSAFGVGQKNDFISRPGQPIQSFNPNDTLIGVKNPEMLGGAGVTVNIGNVFGMDPRQVADALQTRLEANVQI